MTRAHLYVQRKHVRSLRALCRMDQRKAVAAEIVHVQQAVGEAEQQRVLGNDVDLGDGLFAKVFVVLQQLQIELVRFRVRLERVHQQVSLSGAEDELVICK